MKKSEELIIRPNYENNYAIDFCNRFFNDNVPKYIFGINEYAESIMEQVNIDGLVDDFTKEKSVKGIPVVSIESISANALVISTVTKARVLSANKRLATFKFEYLDYYSFFKFSPKKVKQIEYLDGAKKDILENFDKYNSIYQLLSDDISKSQFYNLVNFRTSYNIEYLRGFNLLIDKQYFEDFLELRDSGEVFVDVGSYDGYTAEYFIKKCPYFDFIYIFEPIEENYSFIKTKFKNNSNIQAYNLGLSDKKDILNFELDGSASKISESGGVKIKVDKLDNIIKEEVTFIKMDIEGSELSAINGAREIIKKYHPRLAISVYHKKDDFWKIPELILSIRDDYKLYFRHYTEGYIESVMFFIPK